MKQAMPQTPQEAALMMRRARAKLAASRDWTADGDGPAWLLLRDKEFEIQREARRG